MDNVITKKTPLEINYDLLLSKRFNEIPNKLQRDVFILKTFDKQTTKDICTNLNINKKEFWNCIHSVRKNLMDVL